MSSRLDNWEAAATWPGPDRNAIDVWRCALRVTPADYAARLARLNAAEHERAARFRRPADREAFVVMRGTLRERLAVCLGLAPADVPLAAGPHGKPQLAGSEPRWEFNVSHSGDHGLIALAWNRAVGVDIEVPRDLGDAPDLARRFFSATENLALEGAPAAEWRRWFYALWTRKESFVKATGLGLAFPFQDFSVPASPTEAPRLLELAGEPHPERRWRLWDLAAGAGCAAALTTAVTAADGPRVRLWG